MHATQLSNLEQEVMNVIWNSKEVQIRDVLEKMQNKKGFAYTTIATIFHRLEDKGFLTKRLQGNSYFYKPKVSKEVYSGLVARSFLGKFFSSFGSVAVSSFAKSIQDLPEDKKKYLLKLLESETNDK